MEASHTNKGKKQERVGDIQIVVSSLSSFTLCGPQKEHSVWNSFSQERGLYNCTRQSALLCFALLCFALLFLKMWCRICSRCVVLQKPPAGSEGGKPEGGTTSAAAMKQYEMGDELERKPFLDKLFAYLDDKGAPVTATPMISKNPIDLYKLYTIVKKGGGLLEVRRALFG